MKFLIVGLGNIGAEYSHTRHNIGFDVVDTLAKKNNCTFTADRLASVARFSYKGKNIVLIKPSTFMNLSGRSVKYWMNAEKIPLENVLIIADDLALPLGTLRLRNKGNHAGHNGLRNIEEELQTSAYNRLKFGIGNDFPKGGQVSFVLGKWKSEETDILAPRIATATDIILSFCTSGIFFAMNHYNNK